MDGGAGLCAAQGIVIRGMSGDAMKPLRTDNRVSELAFVLPDGTPITLQAFAGHPLLLVFLRHLA